MSRRLQVLLEEDELAAIRRLARRQRTTVDIDRMLSEIEQGSLPNPR